jgi:hypothetical protein
VLRRERAEAVLLVVDGNILIGNVPLPVKCADLPRLIASAQPLPSLGWEGLPA